MWQGKKGELPRVPSTHIMKINFQQVMPGNPPDGLTAKHREKVKHKVRKAKHLSGISDNIAEKEVEIQSRLL